LHITPLFWEIFVFWNPHKSESPLLSLILWQLSVMIGLIL